MVFKHEKSLNLPEENSKKESFLSALKPIIIPLQLVGIQPRIIDETTVSNENKRLIRWWNILSLIYLHVLSLKSVVAIVLTSGGVNFWMQLTTCLRSWSATITAVIYVFNQKKLQLLFKRISFVYRKFTEDDRRRFRRRIRIGAIIVWLFLTAYFAVSLNSACNMGMEKFLSSHIFWFEIPFISTTTQFVLACVFMLLRQLVMWGTLSFMILMYVALCDIIKLSFR